MPLQCIYQRREKGHEAFGADAVGSVPDQEQGVLDVWPVAAWTGVLREGLTLFGMVEEPYGVLTIITSRSSKSIQQLAFPLDRGCLTIQ